mmetsp:Transcript_5335/g.13898  ORF Transcript_5335/g.13898 Transcript_5335/m.13898 type:complete len:94 (-) Transcript_5335:174-455(-)
MSLLTVPPAKVTWTPREAVEQHIQAYLRNPGGKVLIVVGPKASGKSTAARHALRDVRGAALVQLTGKTSSEGSCSSPWACLSVGASLKSTCRR